MGDDVGAGTDQWPPNVVAGRRAERGSGDRASQGDRAPLGDPAPLGEPASRTAGGGSPPVTLGDAWSWVLVAVGGYVIGQLVALVLVSVVAAALGRAGQISHLTSAAVSPGWVVVTELVGLWTGFVGAAWLASHRWGTGHVARDMGLRIRPWDLVIGPVVGVASQLVLVPVLYLPLRPFVPHLDRRLSGPAHHLTGGFPGASLAVIGFLTVVVVPIVEELLFRGVLLRGLLRLFGPAGRVAGPVLAIVVTGLLFGLAHDEGLELLGLAAFGMVLSLLAWRTDRLGPGMLAHGAFNLVAIVTTAYGITTVLPH